MTFKTGSKYVGPTDPETGEALAENVAPDGFHGVGTKTAAGVTYDLAGTQVVGDYIGAQMAGFDAAAPLGLIDHLQSGEVNIPYVERTLVVGGNSPYLASVASGALPPGLIFDPVTGVLSGTPTDAGAFSFKVEATDADAVSVTKAYTLVIAQAGGDPVFAPVISAVASGEVTPITAVITWETDQPATSQVQIGGDVTALDSNLASLHSVVLTGLSPGTTYQFVVISANAAGAVSASVETTFTTLPISVVNATITSVGRNFIVVNGGLQASDHVFYTPTPAGTTFTGGTTGFVLGELVDYTGTLDALGACHALTMVVKPKPTPIVIGPVSLPRATAGVRYSVTITATGGVGPFTFGAAGLPPGLDLSGSIISGMPQALGAYPVTLIATDARGVSKTKVLTLTVVDKTIVFAPTLKAGKVGTPYLVTIKATGGFGAFTYSAANLPPGLSLDGNLISGIPTTAGVFTVSLTATDSLGKSLTKRVSLTIGATAAPHFTLPDEGMGPIAVVGNGFIKVGTKFILYNSNTQLILNDTATINIGDHAQWKGRRDSATGLVLADKLEIN